jgi:hypothetical protein
MTVVLRPNHPARLFGVFAAALGAFALVAAAAYAAMYIVDQETAGPASTPAPAAEFDIPDDMVIIRPTDLAEWDDLLGFEPVVAEALPAGVVATPLYFLQPNNPKHGVAGHVRYAYEDGTPAISLIEQSRGLDTTSPMTAVESAGTRVHLVNMQCGDIVIQAQMFFPARDTAPQDPKATSAAAAAFFDDLRAQCEG